LPPLTTSVAVQRNALKIFWRALCTPRFTRGPGAPFADKDQFDKNDAAGLDLGRGVAFMPDDADNRADEHGAPDSDGSRRYPYDVQVINLLASIHESIRALLKYSSVSMSRAELSNRSLTSGPDHAGSR
jgi:hypothetical protein